MQTNHIGRSVNCRWMKTTGPSLEASNTPDPPPGQVKEREIVMKYGLAPEDAWSHTDLFIDAFGRQVSLLLETATQRDQNHDH